MNGGCANQFPDCISQIAIGMFHSISLHLKVKDSIRPFLRGKEIKHFIESGNDLHRVFWASKIRMSTIKPTSDINPAELLRRHPRDRFVAKPGALQGRIMNDNRNAVTR